MVTENYPNLLFVIGASAGGVSALLEIVDELPPSLQATVVVATHRPVDNPVNSLSDVLQRKSDLKVKVPLVNEQLECTTIYLGMPGEALRIEECAFHKNLVQSFADRMKRIDDLFVSAAQAAKDNCVGVILSGVLDDGISGLKEIRRHGGKCVIQKLTDATFEDMPKQALEAVDPDFVGTAKEIGAYLVSLTKDKNCISVKDDN